MSVVRGIIFDKDGTLFDFGRTWEAWSAAFLRRVTQNEEEAIKVGAAIGFDVVGRRFDPQSIIIAGTPGEITETLLPHLPQFQFDELLAVLNAEAEVAPQAEAVSLRPFLTQLRARGLRLGVVTNDAEKPARAHLETAGVTEMFDFIAGFDSGFGAKPDPGQLLAFANITELEPKNILMVGDSLHDLVAAHRAQMRGIGVLTGVAEADSLASYAEVVLPDIGHLPAWIDMQSHRSN